MSVASRANKHEDENGHSSLSLHTSFAVVTAVVRTFVPRALSRHGECETRARYMASVQSTAVFPFCDRSVPSFNFASLRIAYCVYFFTFSFFLHPPADREK